MRKSNSLRLIFKSDIGAWDNTTQGEEAGKLEIWQSQDRVRNALTHAVCYFEYRYLCLSCLLDWNFHLTFTLTIFLFAPLLCKEELLSDAMLERIQAQLKLRIHWTEMKLGNVQKLILF